MIADKFHNYGAQERLNAHIASNCNAIFELANVRTTAIRECGHKDFAKHNKTQVLQIHSDLQEVIAKNFLPIMKAIKEALCSASFTVM